MIYLLLLIIAIFVVINYKISDSDFMNPSVIFCFVFFCSNILCVFYQQRFAISIYPKTLLVITMGFTVFSIINCIFHRSLQQNQCSIKEIKINKWLIYLLIVLQAIAIIFFMKHLRDLSFAYDQKNRSLSEQINLFDTLTKFLPKKYKRLNVPMPMVYRVLNPMVHTAGYMSVYILVNNWFATKKIDYKYLGSSLMLCILIFLNGSRSPYLRIITMVIILFYIFGYRTSKFKLGDSKLLLKIIVIMALLCFCLLLMVKVMRPGVKIGNLGEYIFIYAGAPLVNLNNWLVRFSGIPNTSLFGGQTFRMLYRYIGKWTGNTVLENYKSINVFAYSQNKIEIGNVYTCFYFLLYDFSYIGMLLMIAVMAVYYVIEYQKLMTARINPSFDTRLFFYSFLFNDLVMSFFSTRFYETTVNPDFIKIMIFTLILNRLFINTKPGVEKSL